ncbi:MAG: metalloregulator ArsR/SmtB family transcription factor [Acidobacteria bacterium]|nr:metalloregulator ArsR/SmtB family transcription factor [Acidobacteriota bacterium]
MSQDDKFDIALFFAALADRTRLRLLNLMRDGEICVCFLADTLQTNDPKISRHLAYLKRANLVRARRDGKWMHYRINEPLEANAAQILSTTLELLDSDAEMQRDRKRLVKVCCPPMVPVAISQRTAKT